MTQREAWPSATTGTTTVVVLETRRAFMKNYNYLVVDARGRDAVIVDPAWQLETVEQAVAQSGARLGGVLITHAHLDHVHLAKTVASRHDCPIWMSRSEVAASGFDAPSLIAFDDRPWRVGGLSIEPIWTPGHTPGSVCYLIGDDVFTGDVLFAEGCGLCPDRQAAYAMFASLAELKRRLAPHTRVFPGHSYGKPPGQRMAQVSNDNMYLHFTDRESFAAYRLRGGQHPAKALAFR